MSQGPTRLPTAVLDAIKVVFFQECDELIAELEASLLALEDGQADAETINAAFRAAHSIKGSAGAFGFDTLVHFAHGFEAALHEVRSGAAPSDTDVVKTLLRATDVLADLVAAARTGRETDAGRSEALLADLAAIARGDSGEPDLMDGLDFSPRPVVLDLPVERCWTILVAPRASLYARANDPLLLIQDLARLGDAHVELHSETLPPLDQLDPEQAYLAWTVSLTTTATAAQIREVFEFVEDDCDLDIALEAATPSEPAVSDIEWFADPDDIGRPPAAAAAATAGRAPAPPAPVAPTIRVDPDRVDRLIDLAGELTINQAVLSQRLSELGLPRTSPVRAALDELEQLSRELQDRVMAIRAQPVKVVFQRMSRLVRETAEHTGKAVRLVTEGEAVEIDRTVIERLTDPITHMLRNAIDHGVESPAERAAAGKPAEGVVRLSARHRSGQVVIEVSDDGRGVDRARVREIAVARGLTSPDAELTDAEIDNLIFAPGFSTAATVSDLSGRGVGLDVVRRSVQSLGGRITIASEPGVGATMTLSLPLTLAVLDGMVVRVADQTLIAPLSTVVQMLRPEPGAVRTLGAATTLLSVGDVHLPIIDVGVALGYRSAPIDPAQGVVLLVEGGALGRGCLLVDSIQDQRQVVMKSLEANYRPVPGVAAATVLGDGRVALIMDVDAILEGFSAPEPERRTAAQGLRA